MNKLIIECPNGELKFPPDILNSSPYIKGTLIDTHFFGKFNKSAPFFLTYDISIVKLLIRFIRSGFISNNDEYVEMLTYINAGSDGGLLNDGLIMINEGVLNKYGAHEKVSTLYLNDLSITLYDKEEQMKRQDVIKTIAKDALKEVLIKYLQFTDYLIVEEVPRHMHTKLITAFKKYGDIETAYNAIKLSEMPEFDVVKSNAIKKFNKKFDKMFYIEIDHRGTIYVFHKSADVPPKQSIYEFMSDVYGLLGYTIGKVEHAVAEINKAIASKLEEYFESVY